MLADETVEKIGTINRSSSLKGLAYLGDDRFVAIVFIVFSINFTNVYLYSGLSPVLRMVFYQLTVLKIMFMMLKSEKSSATFYNSIT